MTAPFLLLFLMWQEPAELDQVLHKVQANVAQFEASLPDFVCSERITSSRFSGAKIAAQTVNESLFASSQTGDALEDRETRETREMISIDGKKVDKRQGPKGPFILLGGFSGAAAAIFDARIAPYRNYSLAQEENGKIVIKFSTKKGQSGIGAASGGKKFLAVDSGKAWINPATMQVVRLETLVVNGPSKYPFWSTTVEYAQVTIDGKPFWMPKTVRSDLRRKLTQPPERQFSAEYTNYRKFDVSSGIVYR